MSFNGAPTILLTRPQAASDRFAAALREEIGPLRIVISPLMDIVPSLTHLDLEGSSGLIFTSTNGVQIFAGLSDERGLPAWCVGPQTATAAREIGLEAMSAAGDADALVKLMSEAQPVGRHIHLRGHHTRGDVVSRLCQKGVRAEGIALYDQRALAPSETFLAAVEGSERLIVPLFSPRSATLFLDAIAGRACAPMTAVALSPAVAEDIPRDRFEQLDVAPAPNAPALIRAIAAAISR